MRPEFEIQFRAWGNGPPPGLYPAFRVSAGDSSFTYSLSLGEELGIVLTRGRGLSPEALARLPAAVLRLNVRRLQAGLRSGVLPPEGKDRLSLFVGYDDETELTELMLDKTCDYQLRDGRRLLCSAAASNDETSIGTMGIASVAPTSRHLCLRCKLPDTDHICSHLLDPRVVGIRMRTIVSRDLADAMCDLGRSEISDPAGCRAGGHDCWRRTVEREVPSADADTSPLALVRAVDYLDVAGKATLGRRLFEHRSAESLSGLTGGSSTRAEFAQRLNELDGVIQQIIVPADRKVDVDSSARSLTRLAAYLEVRFDEVGLEEAKAPTAGAVKALKCINDVRVSLEHPGGARVTAPDAFAALGLAYPPTDWSEAWDSVRSIAASALRALAQQLLRLE